MAEFMDRYGSDDKCEAALIESRWPSGFACPACGCGQSSSFRREGRLYFQCTACRYQCSVISGTIFESTKLPLTRWFLAMHLLTQSKNNVSALELKRHLGVSYKTAWLIKHKLMEVMRLREDAPPARRPRGDRRRLPRRRALGRQGRARLGEQGAVHRRGADHARRPAAVHVPAPGSRSPQGGGDFAASRWLAPSATLVSDGLGCFTRRPARRRCTSASSPAAARPAPSCPSSARQHGAGQPQDRAGRHVPRLRVRQVRASLSRRGPYRFNRRFDLRSILARLLRAACLTTPTPCFRHSCG